jgi:hypothetical protein
MSQQEPTLELNFTLAEVHALHKTVGIAIDNLNMKMSKSGHGKAHSQASSDMRALLGVQQEILTVLGEVM